MSILDYYKKYEPIFGSWYITKEIGRGSFGVVYEIEQPSNGYKSAMKAITIPSDKGQIVQYRNQGMDDASITSYFSSAKDDLINEFRLMELMKGETNIVSYEDQLIIPHDDIGWDILVRMELLTDLSGFVVKNGFTLRDLLNLGIDMCNALEICEEYSIVHRDIKPANIFVSSRGKYKLGDFGIARTIEKTTGGLSKKGTYNFMAPEVYLSKEYGPSVDLYSLGIVLYFYANSRRTPFLPPFPLGYSPSDAEQALTRRIRGEKVPALENIPAQLSDIILKACEYDSHDRFRTPGELKNALRVCKDNLVKSGVDMSVNLCPDSKTFKKNDDGDDPTRGALLSSELEKRKAEAKAAELAKTEKMYSDAVQKLSCATTQAEYMTVVDQLTALTGYKDVDQLIKQCNAKINSIKAETERKIADLKRKEAEYASAMAAFNCAVTVEDYIALRERFSALNGFKDSVNFAEKCYAAAKSLQLELEKEAKLKAEAERQARLENQYKQAMAKLEDADCIFASALYSKSISVYAEAAAMFDKIRDFKDSVQKSSECRQKIKKTEDAIQKLKEETDRLARLEKKYTTAAALMLNAEAAFKAGQFDACIPEYKEAISSFADIIDYKDVKAKIAECNKKIETAEKEIERRKAEEEAKRIAALKAKYSEAESRLAKAEKEFNAQKHSEASVLYSQAAGLFSAISNYADSTGKANACIAKAKKADLELKKQKEEQERIKKLEKEYAAATDLVKKAEKAYSSKKFSDAVNSYGKAQEQFSQLNDFKDASSKTKLCSDKQAEINEQWSIYKEQQRIKREAAKKLRIKILCVAAALAVVGFIIYKIVHVPSYYFPELSSSIVLAPGDSFDAYNGCDADPEDYSAFTLESDNDEVITIDGSRVTANKEGVATITFTQNFGRNKIKTSEHHVVVIDWETDFSDCSFSDNGDGSYRMYSSDLSGYLFYIDGKIYIQDDDYEILSSDTKRLNHFAEDNGYDFDSLKIAVSRDGTKYIVYSDDGYKVQKLSSIDLVLGEWSSWDTSLPSGVSNSDDYDVEKKYQYSELIMVTESIGTEGCDGESEAVSTATAMVPSGATIDYHETYQDENGFWAATVYYSYYSNSWTGWTDCSSAGEDSSTVKYQTLYRYRTVS